MAKRHRSHYNEHRPKGVSKRDFERVYWPYLPLVIVVSLVLAFGGLSARAMTDLRGGVLAYSTSMSASGLLSNTNQKRAENGAGALSLNSKLSAAAQAKANDMASRNYWSHNTPEGNPPWVFVDAQGYPYQKIGENLAAGFSNESSTITGWMNSAAHRANMLDIAFTEVGFGYANNADYTSAGGGPMTIVVAFYGVTKAAVIPTPCPNGQIGTPPNCADPPKQVATAPKATPPAPTPTPPTPTKTTTPATQPVPGSNPTKQPITNQGVIPINMPTKKSSQLEVVLGASATAWTASATMIVMVIVGGLWITRHAVIARRALINGENFVIHHPLIDVGFLTILAVAYLMSRTSGLVL